MTKFTLYDEKRICDGLIALLIFDQYLLWHNLSERSITHKLAEHYQHLFHEWNVDCEFNRNLERSKDITISPREILNAMANKLEGSGYLLNIQGVFNDKEILKEQMRNLEIQLRDSRRLEVHEEIGVALFTLTLLNGKTTKKTIFPDIIIHHRGTMQNHVVIEAKKSINSDLMDRAYDLVKLMTLVASPDFRYKRGYFIDLPVARDFQRFTHFQAAQLFTKNVYRIIPEYK